MLTRRGRLAGVALALLAGGWLPGLTVAQDDTGTEVQQALPPPVIAHLQSQGLTLTGPHGEVDGIALWAVPRVQGQELIYVLPDGRRAIVGTMLDAEGNNLTAQQQAALPPPDPDALWAELEDAAWVAEGAASPQRVIYSFTDPNCPYCHKLWQATALYHDEGLQVRHVMVAVIKPSSAGKAAAILGAEDPAAALDAHFSAYEQGGIAPVREPGPAIVAQIADNNRLMDTFGVQGTPALVFREAGGQLRIQGGLPSPEVLAAAAGVPARPSMMQRLRRLFGMEPAAEAG
ncbi:MAG: thiol:disulfide interchange protein DsbG [Pseudomonadota bacterium]|nr:thiol:disulfide interchange protein DsbG [Pseudomonadota bacterium]